MNGESRRLVLASRNAKKLREMQTLLSPLGYQLQLVSEFTDEAADETASSFVENALLKARHACRVSGLPAIADDSGIEVDALSGRPGVWSARYAGTDASDAQNNALLLHELRDTAPAARGARFVCVMAMLRHADDPVPVIAQGLWRGQILPAPRGLEGFGYDPLFWVSEHQCSSAELAPETKNRISHRALASRSLLAQLQGSGT